MEVRFKETRKGLGLRLHHSPGHSTLNKQRRREEKKKKKQTVKSAHTSPRSGRDSGNISSELSRYGSRHSVLTWNYSRVFVLTNCSPAGNTFFTTRIYLFPSLMNLCELWAPQLRLLLLLFVLFCFFTQQDESSARFFTRFARAYQCAAKSRNRCQHPAILQSHAALN